MRNNNLPVMYMDILYHILIHSHTIYPLLQFYGSSWKTYADANTNIELFCHSQCSTQILDKLYIFGAFDTNDKVHSSLLKYQLNSPGTTWIDTTYSCKSDLSQLTHLCVANNGSNIFILGGLASPFHNIQMQCMFLHLS